MGRDDLLAEKTGISQNFNPLSPHGERLQLWLDTYITPRFQSTLPAWGETESLCQLDLCKVISIHSPRMGRDCCGGCGHGGEKYFNPLSPHGERPRACECRSFPDISIHSPRMGRDLFYWSTVQAVCISIHSPRMGRDAETAVKVTLQQDFNPLSPHGERPSLPILAEWPCPLFQSTLPAWGETEKPGKQRACPADFNPLSPHGERPRRRGATTTPHTISIHSPRMGRDAGRRHAGQRGADFNPLSPHGERRNNYNFNRYMDNFNPLSPHGERLVDVVHQARHNPFQSTLPAWGETHRGTLGGERQTYFNPLSPHGERPICIRRIGVPRKFQSTLPAWGETRTAALGLRTTTFQSTLPAWGETAVT